MFCSLALQPVSLFKSNYAARQSLPLQIGISEESEYIL
jgi:hypothetical protein